jgi:hypothetical protein
MSRIRQSGAFSTTAVKHSRRRRLCGSVTSSPRSGLRVAMRALPRRTACIDRPQCRLAHRYRARRPARRIAFLQKKRVRTKRWGARRNLAETERRAATSRISARSLRIFRRRVGSHATTIGRSAPSRLRRTLATMRNDTAVIPAYRQLTARLLCDAATDSNMVIPQPHRQIAKIDAAIRRNRNAK